jgi:hypothetical protein
MKDSLKNRCPAPLAGGKGRANRFTVHTDNTTGRRKVEVSAYVSLAVLAISGGRS